MPSPVPAPPPPPPAPSPPPQKPPEKPAKQIPPPSSTPPPFPLGREAAYPRGPRPYMGGGCIPELMHRMSRHPGMTNVEVTFSKTFRLNPMDDCYLSDGYGPPHGGMPRLPPQRSRHMAPPLPPLRRRSPPPPPQDYQHGPPGQSDHHHAYDYPYGGPPPPDYNYGPSARSRHDEFDYHYGPPPPPAYYGGYSSYDNPNDCKTM